MLTQEHHLDLFADNFQFYIQDEKVSGNLSESWTEDANLKLLAQTDGVVGVGTARNMDVPVTLKLFSTEPPIDDFEMFDQINECDIFVNSGCIVVAGCTEYFPDAFRIKTQPGLYRVRLYYKNLNKLSVDGLQGEDTYELHLWPENRVRNTEVLKQFQRASA